MSMNVEDQVELEESDAPPTMESKYVGADYVLAIDPGKRTGWTLYRVSTDEFNVGELEWNPMCGTIDSWCSQLGDKLHVVIEKFVITVETAKNTAAPWSMEMIGVARYHAAKNGCGFSMQAPSSAKRFSTDTQLKAIGWHRPGLGHGNDSSRHMLLYLVSRRWWSPKLLIG